MGINEGRKKVSTDMEMKKTAWPGERTKRGKKQGAGSCCVAETQEAASGKGERDEDTGGCLGLALCCAVIFESKVHRTSVHAQSLSGVQLFCNPMDCSPSGSPVQGLFQERILEWVAISYFRGAFQPRDGRCISCIGRRVLYRWATWEASVG